MDASTGNSYIARMKYVIGIVVAVLALVGFSAMSSYNGFVSLQEDTIYCYSLKSSSDSYNDVDSQFTIKFKDAAIPLPNLDSELILSTRDS